MTIPQIETDPEELARVRAEFTGLIQDAESSGEQPLPKRGRGRPRGSKNRSSPKDFEPYRPEREEEDPLPTLASPPLTARDQREVAKRLAGILQGVTGVASVAKPYFAMTDKEAEGIATPLSTYLLRQEQFGSAGARQILEEYDLAAFVIAMAAYVVRVYLDFQKEREDAKSTSSNPSVAGRSRPDDEQRQPIARPTGTIIRDDSLQSQDGTERPVSRELASVSQSQRFPTDL
jgi:hypothetical protein